jgi:hypothetical protein
VSSTTDVSIDEVLQALRSVPGVRSADIGDDETGGAGLLRLDLAADVDEVEVASTVGRLLRERFGLGVDAGQVQMVEAAADFAAAHVSGADEAGESDSASTGDVRVTVMNVTSHGRKVIVSIVLRRGERECRGEAPGTTSSDGVLRAVAAATLHAIEELTEDAVIGRLEHLAIAEGSASVELVLDVDGLELSASGTSPVHSDPRQAIVRAVLEAVQPHLPSHIPD